MVPGGRLLSSCPHTLCNLRRVPVLFGYRSCVERSRSFGRPNRYAAKFLVAVPLECFPSVVSTKNHSIFFLDPHALFSNPIDKATNHGGSKPSKNEVPQYDPDYHLQMAMALKTLLAELPHFFHQPLTYDIYTRDIEWRFGGRSTRGRAAYKALMLGFRSYVHVCCRQVRVEVWRFRHNAVGAIFLRWRLHVRLRVVGAETDFEGVSEYRLNKKGKISCHIIEITIRNDLGSLTAESVRAVLERIEIYPHPQPA